VLRFADVDEDNHEQAAGAEELKEGPERFAVQEGQE
jgi:hypothetical protein